MTKISLDLSGVTQPGTYAVCVESVECIKSRDLVWTLRITSGPKAGAHISMVTPIDQPSQLWLLKKALVSLGVIEHMSETIALDVGDDGRLVSPGVEGRVATARVRQLPKGPRIELLRPRKDEAA